MPASDTLLVLLLVAVAIAIVLLVLLLLRRPDDALERLRLRVEEALRDEQRAGRGELRQQLDSLGANQGQRIDAFGRSLDELRAALNDDAPGVNFMPSMKSVTAPVKYLSAACA